jgi:nickel transport protein
MPGSRILLPLKILLLAGLLPLFAGQALAHSVHIFAWADAERICTESYFSKSNRVRDGQALMADAAGKVLARAGTDENGLACFPVPEKPQDLTFSVLAGPGHRGQFELRAVDLAASFPQAPSSADSSAELSDVGQSPPPLLTPGQAGQADELRLILSRELQRQLAPVVQTLAEIKADHGPGAREIIGGIGWIMGIAALAQWFALRRKKTAADKG